MATQATINIYDANTIPRTVFADEDLLIINELNFATIIVQADITITVPDELNPDFQVAIIQQTGTSVFSGKFILNGDKVNLTAGRSAVLIKMNGGDNNILKGELS